MSEPVPLAPPQNRLMNDIFGDSDDENDDIQPQQIAPPRYSAPATVSRTAIVDTDGLFESDEEEAAKPSQPVTKRPRLEKLSKASAGRATVADSGSIKKKSKKKERSAVRQQQQGRVPAAGGAAAGSAAGGLGDSSDEYASEEEVERTAEDDRFIDAEDDNADLLREYDEDRQDFRDERPAADKRKERRDNEDAGGARDGDPVTQALSDMKGKKAAKLTEEQKQTLAQELLFRMDRAAKEDDQLFESKQPAICKINMLDAVQRMVGVRELQHTLLEFDLLGVLKVWIEPRDARSLPSLTVRKAVYEMLLRLPCQADHLKRSGIGKTVVALRKHKGEIPENKALLKALMEKWSRPIFSKSSDARLDGYDEGLKSFELRAAAQERRAAQEQAEEEATAAARHDLGAALLDERAAPVDLHQRARVPYSNGYIFTVRPEVKAENKPRKAEARTGGKVELERRMKALQSQGMRVKMKSR